MLNKIKLWFLNQYRNLIVLPRIKREKDKKEAIQLAIKNENIKKIKEEFGNKFNVDVDRVNHIINFDAIMKPDKRPFLVGQLIKDRNKINEQYPLLRRSPLFFEPETVEQHNINLDDKAETINELIMKTREASEFSLIRQADKHGLWSNKKKIKGRYKKDPRVTSVSISDSDSD